MLHVFFPIIVIDFIQTIIYLKLLFITNLIKAKDYNY